jgi:transcriptional regulator with AAA-type ATPase domain/polyferredoxin
VLLLSGHSEPRSRRGDAIAALSEAAIAYLRAEGREVDAPEGTVVVRQGEAGRAFFTVLSGEAEAHLLGPDGSRMPLARFGPGASFGEMALLRGEPVSATVVALSPVVLLELPGDRFKQALAECEPLRSDLLAMLSDHLRRTSREAWELHQRAQAYHSLLDSGAHDEKLVVESAHMRKVATRIGALAAATGPVLVTGEPGAGKLLVARKLHEAAGSGPLVVVDCAQLPEEDACRILLGAAETAGATDTGGMLGAVHLASRGTLVLRHVDALPRSAQERLAGFLESGPAAGAGPRVRVVATTAADLAAAAMGGRFDAALASRLGAATVAVPRLCDRKLDVLPLVRLFLAARAGAAAPRLAQDAEHAFVSRRYRNRNVAELREAVELAADFAGGDEIRAEHIFAGPKSEAGPAEVDLGGTQLAAWLTRPGTLTALRGGVLASFAAVIGLTVAAPHHAAGRFANVVIWGVWEPAIIAAFLLVGRVWCTVCPLSTAGRLATRLLDLRRPPPAGLKQAGIWLGTVGFFAILWVERVFHMTRAPLPSGVLLLALMGAAAVFAVLYQRETWCRYVCPLGTLAAGYALPAPLQVRANPNVCATYCTDHACYKGTDARPGCSVFHHPLFASEGHLCKLCFSCVHVCPHGSAKLYARPPLQAVWRLGGLSEAMAPFSLSVLFLAPVILAAQRIPWLSGPLPLAAAMAAALAAGGLAARLLPAVFGSAGDDAISPRVAFALLVLAWGPLMAYQLGNVGALATVRLQAVAATPLAAVLPPEGVALQVVMQLATVALALVLAMITLWRTGAWLRRHGEPPVRGRWRALLVAALAYAAGSGALLLV